MSPSITRGWRAVACLAAIAVVVAPATASAAGHRSVKSHKAARSSQVPRSYRTLFGSWQVTVTFNSNPPPGVTGPETALQGFGAGGLLSEFASATRTTGFGVWRATDRTGGFAYTFHELEFLPDGTLAGYVIAHQTGRVSPNGQSYTSSGSGQIYSPAGVALAPPSQTSTNGTRITL
jgi:hypothetical protein